MDAKKKRKRPMLNEEAIGKLKAAGFEMNQFKLEGLSGYYVPLQLWSKYVGKFNPSMKRGWRVELNTESTRQVKRRFNMEEINEMTASLGIGNGNCYVFDRDEKLMVDISLNKWYNNEVHIDNYRQPIKVGNRFVTNIIQSHRMYNAKKKERGILFKLSARTPQGEQCMKEDLETNGNYVNCMHRWEIDKEIITQTHYQNVVMLKPDGVLRGIKQPYGTISGVYVHFFSSWKTKREARYHVTFDHGARVVITNDWLTRSWATTYPEGVTFKTCGHSGKRNRVECSICSHIKVHKEKHECSFTCRHTDAPSCVTVMDYRDQNMFVVHRGDSFKIPRPVREPVKYVELEEQLEIDNKHNWMLTRGYIPKSKWEVDNIIESLLSTTGGRKTE